MKATVKNNTLTIEIPFDATGVPSKSGKTMVHATTHGNQPTAVNINGKPLVVGLSAYSKQ